MVETKYWHTASSVSIPNTHRYLNKNVVLIDTVSAAAELYVAPLALLLKKDVATGGAS